MKAYIEQALMDLGWDEARYPWPSRRLEHWKYDARVAQVPLGEQADEPTNGPVEAAVVCEDGWVSIAPEWQSVLTWSDEAIDECIEGPRDAFQFWMDHGQHPGIRLSLRAGVEIDQPIVIRIRQGQSTSRPTHYRHAIEVGEHAKATICCVFEGNEHQHWLHHHMSIRLAKGAQLSQFEIHQNAKASEVLSSSRVWVGDHAHYTLKTHQEGAKLNRHTVSCVLAGFEAKADFKGVMKGSGDECLSQIIQVWHQGERSNSQQVYRSLVADQAQSVWHSTVTAEPHVKDMNSKQDNKNLLVGPRAKAFTRPELAIAAHQVKCAHGATIGQMDERALLYLKSRGYSEEDAKQVLQQAFLADLYMDWPQWALDLISSGA